MCKIERKISVSEQAWNFIKKENLARVFSCDFYEIFLEQLFKRAFPDAFSIIIAWITNFLRFSFFFNLNNLYLWVFWLTLYMFLFYLSSNYDHTNSFDFCKVCTLCLLNIVAINPVLPMVQGKSLGFIIKSSTKCLGQQN